MSDLLRGDLAKYNQDIEAVDQQIVNLQNRKKALVEARDILAKNVPPLPDPKQEKKTP